MLHLCRLEQSILPGVANIRRAAVIASTPLATRHYLSTMQAQPRFSQGTDVATASSTLAPLLSAPDFRWELSSTGDALERSFKFKTFAKTWDFMTAVSLQCKIKNHHPEWSNVYNTTLIRWTTHNPNGLSQQDIDMATLCDSLARDFGEIKPELASDALKGLARKVAEAGRDCCNPKKAS